MAGLFLLIINMQYQILLESIIKFDIVNYGEKPSNF
jgi:hypothetical protein